MNENISATEVSIVSRNRVTDAVRTILHVAVKVERRFTVEEIADHSKVKVRALRSYMSNDPTEVREPSLSAALSIAVVLGPRAINSILSIIGYTGAHPVDEGDAEQPFDIIANLMDDVNTIVQAGKDNRFDHIERPVVKAAADHIIATLVPISSAGDAE